MWILNGLALRIAHSLGLHRDGTVLGLPPFQTEIRRRLWWHLVSRDSRAGEDYGLENTHSLLLASGVNMPSNLDDTDLHPDMQLLPKAKEGWTTMTFALIKIDLAKTLQMLAAIASSSSPSSPPDEITRAQIIKDANARREKMLVHCNPVIPQHRLTIFYTEFILQKLDFVSKLQWNLLRRAGSNADFASEQNLVEALDILEPRLQAEDALLQQFAWIRKAYPQYHVVMYVLWHLCVKPEGPSTDRAWGIVEAIFTYERWDETTMGFSPKPAVLVAVKAKAVSLREKLRRSNVRDARDEQPNSNLGPGEGRAEIEFSPASISDDVGDDGLGSAGGSEDWLDWDAMVQSVQLDFPNDLWQW